MPKKGSKRSPKSGSQAVEEEEEEDFDKVLQEFTAQDPGKSQPVARRKCVQIAAEVNIYTVWHRGVLPAVCRSGGDSANPFVPHAHV